MLTKRGLLFISVSLFLFTAFLSTPSLSAELAPIKLGVNLPFSGIYAEEGKLAYAGAILAIEDANAKGGIKGQKITFIHLDDATDPARAVTNAKRLIGLQKFPVIVGSCSTAMTLGLLSVAEPAKIPTFGCCVAGAAAYNRHYFFSQPNDLPSMEAAVSKIAADGHKTFVHLYLNNAWGIGNIELVNEFASKKGLRVLSHTAVEPESTDLTVLVTRVMATKPNVVIPKSQVNRRSYGL